MDKLTQLASRFALEGAIAQVKPLGEGFINDTYTVTLEGQDQPSYILQRKNHLVFPDVPAMMDNIERVTRYIKTKVHDPLRQTLTVVPTTDGALYYKDEDGNYWAVTLYIRGTMSYTKADSPEIAYQGGLGLGQFHRLVDGFTEPLAEVIKGFHNIRWRFVQWDEALQRDAAGRVKDLKEEIGWIESRREKMLAFWELFEKGVIPTRVTHNDTKISNFLFNADDRSLLCAIDLDTLMSSTLLNDTGDALRSYTNTAEEDEPDEEKMKLDLRLFRAYAEGYLPQMGDVLSEAELKSLATGAAVITLELASRFLGDYIIGDKYFRIDYPEHNLVRAKAQLALFRDMMLHMDDMQAIIAECCK